MKKIFDWLREQVIRNPYDRYSEGVLDGMVLAESFINEAEAKWESEACEWKKVNDTYKNTCGKTTYTHWCSCIRFFKYCPYCGKRIKISEVE